MLTHTHTHTYTYARAHKQGEPIHIYTAVTRFCTVHFGKVQRQVRTWQHSQDLEETTFIARSASRGCRLAATCGFLLGDLTRFYPPPERWWCLATVPLTGTSPLARTFTRSQHRHLKEVAPGRTKSQHGGAIGFEKELWPPIRRARTQDRPARSATRERHSRMR